jgi:coatomer subunit beta
MIKDVFTSIRNPNVYRSALWILGEYSDSSETIVRVLELVKQSLGELPVVDSELREQEGEEPNDVKKENSIEKKEAKPKQLVTADGTYATQSALLTSNHTPTEKEKPILRKLLLEGNFFVASSLATDLTKLVLRFAHINKGRKVGELFVQIQTKYRRATTS